jgi:DNA-binding transcriptional ArsR family regulator
MSLSGNQFVSSFGSVIALKSTSGEASMTYTFPYYYYFVFFLVPSLLLTSRDITIKWVFKHLTISLIIKIMWVLDCQMTSRSEMLQLHKKRDMIATKIAEHFNFTLQALSFPFRILTDADLITEKKQEKNRFYSVKRRRFLCGYL